MRYNLKEPLDAAQIKFKFKKPSVRSTIIMEGILSDYENLKISKHVKSKTEILRQIAKKFNLTVRTVSQIISKKSPYDKFFNHD